jgi:DUF1680 family protein
MPLHRRLWPLSFAEMQIDDPFWSSRLKLLSEATLPQQYDQIANQTGRLRNFKRAAAGEMGGHEGRYYDDSDVYKWLEACAYALRFNPNSKLAAMADEVIQAVEACQMADGYINTYFQLMHPDKRFLNLSYLHEMYCMGHLMEAGVAWNEALGDRRLLDVSIKVANLLWEIFGPGKRNGYCGHQEVELALFRLAEHVRDDRYAELGKLFIERRGHKPTPFDDELQSDDVMALSPWANRYLNLRGDYFQDHAPIREHRIVVGHAVRAMYFYTGAVQFAGDDAELETALRSVWQNMVGKRMYVTGGIGSTASNEGFTNDYDLPNYNSYAETCASVGLALWGRQMLEHTGESDFADVAERAIFNGALPGISASGDAYFYANPLESRADHARVPWFDCACCPPNIARLIGSIGKLAYSAAEGLFAVHFPIAGRFGVFSVQSNYPQSSAFSLRYEGKGGTMELRIRIPDWCDDATIELKGTDDAAEYDNGYAVFRRTWKTGDTVEVDWNQEPRWVESHPMVFENAGKAALMVGPLVYCLESAGVDQAPQHFIADEAAELIYNSSGMAVAVPGFQLESGASDELYRSFGEAEYDEREAIFTPYFGWGNAGKAFMSVWVRMG